MIDLVPPGAAHDPALIAATNEAGARLHTGAYVADFDEGVHPYGKPDACPFCRELQNWTALIYNGPGAPPSYMFACGCCGAQGPTSQGFERGDHWGARIDAIVQWNGHRPRKLPLRLFLRRRLAGLLKQIANWLEVTS